MLTRLLMDSLGGSALTLMIACVSPVAVERYRRLGWVYEGEELASRVKLLPHSVESMFEVAENSLPGCLRARTSRLDSTMPSAS